MANKEFFEWKCWRGLERKNLSSDTYKARLTYEIEVITKLGYHDYFLVMADLIGWAKANQIITGAGRGSAAGSLVSYCLGITNVDPIRYGLYFERFLNEARVGSPPDIDFDTPEAGRERLIQYAKDKYGSDRVAQIATFGMMKAKAAIRDAARALGYDWDLGDKLAKLTLEPDAGKPFPLLESIERVPELASYYSNPKTDEYHVLIAALRIEDYIRNSGVHASGVIISPQPLAELVPLTTDKDDQLVCETDMTTLEKLGLVKFDFLGLNTLGIIQTTLKLIQKRHSVTVDIDNLNLNDPSVYELLQRGDTCGVFQFESDGMVGLLREAKPTSLDDISILLALYRPGPLGSDGLSNWLLCRKGESKPEYLFPELESILSSTDGMMIYQEQIMQICTDICGWSGVEADEMRKIVGKKKPEEMAKIGPKFISSGINRGIPQEKMEALYESIVRFASYGFNKSHSISYGVISYQTAWLKTHYPVEFLCACLIEEGDSLEEATKYISDCRKHSIQVLGPDINESGATFTIVDNTTIRFGLSAIKNLGAAPAEEIIRYQPYTDFREFIQQKNDLMNRKKIESLILAGAFDFQGKTRRALITALEDEWTYRDEHKKYQSKFETYQSRLQRYEERERERQFTIGEGKKPKPSLKYPDKPTEPARVEIRNTLEFERRELLNNERELLGLYLSGHPLDDYLSASRGYCITSSDSMVLRKAGILTSIKKLNTKNGAEMATFILEDRDSTTEFVVFPKFYNKLKSLLVEGNVVGIEYESTGRTPSVSAINALTLDSSRGYKIRSTDDWSIIRNKPMDVLITCEDGSILSIERPAC